MQHELGTAEPKNTASLKKAGHGWRRITLGVEMNFVHQCVSGFQGILARS
jgi:hypothetical protein